MNRKKLKITKEIKIKLIITAVMFVALILSFFFAPAIENHLNIGKAIFAHQTTYSKLSSSSFLVEYIDVGQGNSALITLPDGKTVLVDGGNTMYGETVANFLRSRNVETLDFMIATHADADHIGGLVYILQEFEVKNIFRPFQIAGTGTNAESFVVYEDEDLGEVYTLLQEKYSRRSKISRVTTMVYKNFISGIYSETYSEFGKNNQSNVIVFYDGLKIAGENYEIEFFAPFVHEAELNLQDYSRTYGYATAGYGVTESNSCSAVFTLNVMGETFLFTGDAPFTSGSEEEIPANGYLEIDFVNSLTSSELEFLSNVSVYLAGHHGSSYSSGDALLSVITPKFCVISVGENNSYGQPSESVIQRLKKYKTETDKLLLTSECGTISFGLVGGQLMYVTSSETGEFITISWYLLGTTIFLFIAIIVISLKPIKRKS